MPVTFNFDLDTDSVKDPNDRTRIQVAFLRFGWDHIGGSAWRYPQLDAANKHASEDWMNHVIPALMYFRSIVAHSGIIVTKFSLDAHSEAGHRLDVAVPVGERIHPAADLEFYETGLKKEHDDKLSVNVLRGFMSDIEKLL